jgi:RND family efflux transporter MFP subunit
LTARVTGRVESLAGQFETGTRIGKGEIMARLDDSEYTAAVATARKDVADARLALLEERGKGLQARTEWASSGISGDPESSMVLRTPHLAAAQAAVDDAEAKLAKALDNLEQTRIAAPFDAVVIERRIVPGSYVQPGTEIATLYSTDRMEVAVSLTPADWDKLPSDDELESGRWPVELLDVQHGRKWSGRVLRTRRHLETGTRQRTLILAVDQPFDTEPQLLPGTFLQVDIQGRALDNLWKLPNSALSQKGEIWYVADDGTLDCFSATPAFGDAGFVYVPVPEFLTDAAHPVLTHPLSGYLRGMTVTMVEVPHA